MKQLLSVFEAKDAVDNGADEVDMVINLLTFLFLHPVFLLEIVEITHK